MSVCCCCCSCHRRERGKGVAVEKREGEGRRDVWQLNCGKSNWARQAERPRVMAAWRGRSVGHARTASVPRTSRAISQSDLFVCAISQSVILFSVSVSVSFNPYFWCRCVISQSVFLHLCDFSIRTLILVQIPNPCFITCADSQSVFHHMCKFPNRAFADVQFV